MNMSSLVSSGQSTHLPRRAVCFRAQNPSFKEPELQGKRLCLQALGDKGLECQVSASGGLQAREMPPPLFSGFGTPLE